MFECGKQSISNSTFKAFQLSKMSFARNFMLLVKYSIHNGIGASNCCTLHVIKFLLVLRTE